MKVLVTGDNGQLGYDIIKRLDSENIDYLGTDIESLDITDEKQVRMVIRDYNPDVVIHCAAYTAVDKAEDDRKVCYAVNVLGTKYVAKACKEFGANMVYISTDYVFDGEGQDSFKITDKPNPINYYGQTKYEGELEVQNLLKNYYIVRISWVFGIHGNNFVKTMLKIGKEKDKISVVSDQIGSPTYTFDLSEQLVEMIQTDNYGIYHITNEGYCSWYEFAYEIFKIANMNVKLIPIKTEEYPTKAQRPKNSRLSKNENIRLNIPKMRNWQEALKMMIDEMR